MIRWRRQDAADPACPTGWKRKRFHLSIAAVLTLGFGTLMLLAVASVLAIGITTSSRNTFALLLDKSELAMGGLQAWVRAQMEPARWQAEYLAAMIGRGEVDPKDHGRMRDVLRSALAAAPQITGVGFLDPRGLWLTAKREADGSTSFGVYPDPSYGREVSEISPEQGTAWMDPEWVPDLKVSFLSVRVPVRRDGKVIGLVATGVSFQDLSRFLADMGIATGQRAFILYDDSYVLAHPSLTGRSADFTLATAKGLPPLPRLEDLADPVARAIWYDVDPAGVATGRGELKAGAHVETRIDRGTQGRDLEIRESRVDDVRYVYLLRRITAFGVKPWTLAIAFRADDVDQELQRLARMSLGGFAILIVSVVLALLLGRAISRQIKRLAGAAVALRDLEFRAVPTLPDSRFREISDAAQAFNTMVAGLRWFETYVPKALVLRLIRRGDGHEGVISEEREVTVMFTDIKGFSTIAETMSPQQTAALLNAHFTRIAACIEAEGGTVDKFIGDAVMAFWGAPEEQPDHAVRALRAARAIALAMAEEAAEARTLGRPPVCLRIGIHSGRVVVGNIGAESRINYTIVGDTVNTAARLEALGDGLIAGCDCVVLASDETVRAAGDSGVPLRELGRFSLRGRAGSVKVWALAEDAPAQGASGDIGPASPAGLKTTG
ncbi:adenylate/guanylate cyclase domain-containing protein [Rhodospirillum centenum]|uniref:Adenylate cyclase 2 n=1 Tax=Rhodospirillum centenum (strain ATCC 51521 / SW) TaxID=414684 RepID=B6IPB1_RHOCS|nr:adenylate/guanylate cyclase domain-containing protein [Rhodospirillum centenum]ACI99613.1 adenylate cyclase 2 [Rhodospirillum centenum SW]